jgi:hypothetical protein
MRSDVAAVPAPLAVDGVVTFDPASRSLSVKVSGVGGIYWRRGHAALSAAEDVGRHYSAIRAHVLAPAVWAHAPGRRNIARGEPVNDGWLRFKLSDADYRQLAGEGLSAIATVDKGSGAILSVRFHQRRT